MAPPTCYNPPSEYRPNNTERINHYAGQIILLIAYQVLSSLIIGYHVDKSLYVGVISGICCFVTIMVIVRLSHRPHEFNWWKQTYMVSFLVTGVWSIIFASLLKTTVKDQSKLRMLASANVLALLVILIEVTFVQMRWYFVCKVYPVGYMSYLRSPELQNYLGTNIHEYLPEISFVENDEVGDI